MSKIFSLLDYKIKNMNVILIIILTFVSFFPANFVKALTISPIRYEISGNPGEVLEEKLNLRNETSNTVTFYPHYYNFEAKGETGVPSFIEPKDGLGTWIAGPSGITLAPGDNQTVVFVISIPADAHPGGYFGALLYGTNPPSQEDTQLAIGSETGPIILLRVNGEIKESASIVEFKIKDNQKFFTALPVEMYYRFQNTGSDRTKPTGDLIIKNFLGIKAKIQNANPVEGNILPGQIRKINLAWEKANKPSLETTSGRSFFKQIAYQWHNFALGYFTAKLDLAFGTNDAQKADAKVGFFVVPWQLLIIIMIFLVLVFYILRMSIRKYNQWIIKQAEIAIGKRQIENKSINEEPQRNKI